MASQTTDVPEEMGGTRAGARERFADSLDRAAERLHAKADEMTGRPGKAVDSTAALLDSASTFLDEFEPGELVDEVVGLARKHPGKALIAAALVGYFVGRAMRSER